MGEGDGNQPAPVATSDPPVDPMSPIKPRLKAESTDAVVPYRIVLLYVPMYRTVLEGLYPIMH